MIFKELPDGPYHSGAQHQIFFDGGLAEGSVHGSSFMVIFLGLIWDFTPIMQWQTKNEAPRTIKRAKGAGLFCQVAVVDAILEEDMVV
jgi:hypothetical protein